jgi:hypothetical protein
LHHEKIFLLIFLTNKHAILCYNLREPGIFAGLPYRLIPFFNPSTIFYLLLQRVHLRYIPINPILQGFDLPSQPRILLLLLSELGFYISDQACFLLELSVHAPVLLFKVSEKFLHGKELLCVVR